MIETVSTAKEVTTASVVDEIEKRQLELIDQLTSFLDRLNKSFVSSKPVGCNGKKTERKGKAEPSAAASVHGVPFGGPFFYIEVILTKTYKMDLYCRFFLTFSFSLLYDFLCVTLLLDGWFYISPACFHSFPTLQY